MGNRVSVELKNSVLLITLVNGDDDNRIDAEFVQQLNKALDQAEAEANSHAIKSLLICSSDEKTFCTGLNLDWYSQQDRGQQNGFIQHVDALLIRLSLLSVPTVACINGNCYGAGAILAAACDFRYMREDRGRFCLPAVNVGIVFSKAMNAIIQLLPNAHVVKHLMLTGVALDGSECFAANVVDGLESKEALFDLAFDQASLLADKDIATYVAIRNQMRHPLITLKNQHTVT